MEGEAAARVLRRRLAQGDLWIEVEGDSMRPTLIPPASVRLTGADRPRTGEVWAFVAADGAIVVHRCAGPSGADGFVFRGDGVDHDDLPVGSDALIGRVVGAADQRGTRPIGRGRVRGVGLRLRRSGRSARRLARMVIRRLTRAFSPANDR